MPQDFPGIAALILAAGRGARLGGGKLLLPWQGKPLIRHVLEQAFLVPEFVSLTVVLGHQAPALEHVLQDALSSPPFPLRTAYNPLWREGQSSSLQRGIAALLEARRLKGYRGCASSSGISPGSGQKP